MLNKLQKKWHVDPARFVLIIITFAFGGSLCDFTGRQLLGLTDIEKGCLWVILYVIIITILWPISVLLVSIPFGQFSFFKRYIGNMVMRMRGKNAGVKNEQTNSST